MQRNFKKKDIVKRLGEIALGRANDVIKLAFMDPGDAGFEIDGLDLTMLAEIRRSANGSVELKLISRLEALKTMLEAVEGEPGEESAAFLAALNKSAGEMRPGED